MKSNLVNDMQKNLHSKNGKISAWNNQKHNQYYENVPIEKLKEMAAIGGIENCCDIEVIKAIIFNAKQIVDVGAGYGRVVDYLLENAFIGEITALEKSKHFCRYLEKHFSKKIKIINKDFLDYQPLQKYDVALFMWSTISEFSKLEQPLIINNLMSLLKPNGVLIIETILHTLRIKNASTMSGQNYIIESPYGRIYGYMPSSVEIDDYVAAVGLTVQHKPYVTETNRERIIHLIRYP